MASKNAYGHIGVWSHHHIRSIYSSLVHVSSMEIEDFLLLYCFSETVIIVQKACHFEEKFVWCSACDSVAAVFIDYCDCLVSTAFRIGTMYNDE